MFPPKSVLFVALDKRLGNVSRVGTAHVLGCACSGTISSLNLGDYFNSGGILKILASCYQHRVSPWYRTPQKTMKESDVTFSITM